MTTDGKEIVFPENNVEIMNEILSKNGLLKQEPDLFDKPETEQKTNSEIFSDLIFNLALNKISADEFISQLKTLFKINQQKAKIILEQVQQNLLSQTSNPKKAQGENEAMLPQKQKGSSPEDRYREPIK